MKRWDDDVLRAVAILGGLLVAGALLFAIRDPRVAGFRFEVADLGRATGPAASIALDGRPSGRIWASAGGPPGRAPDEGPARAPQGDLAFNASGGRFVAAAGSGYIRVGTPSGTTTISAIARTAHVVAREDGLVVVSTVSGNSLRIWTSTDEGRTFRSGGAIPARVSAAGPVIVGPFGSLFAAIVTPERALGVAASADGGRTWSARGVTTAHDVDAVPPSIAVDDAATLYVAWTRSGRVQLAHSRDVGITWSEPVAATAARGAAAQLVAGSLGKVGLAYLDGDELVYRFTIEALLPTPFWTEHLVARGVTCARPCATAPFEVTLTLGSRPVLAAVARGHLIVAEQVTGQGVR